MPRYQVVHGFPFSRHGHDSGHAHAGDEIEVAESIGKGLVEAGLVRPAAPSAALASPETSVKVTPQTKRGRR